MIPTFNGLQEENGVLESPTGTGKTLCLLCSSLAWLEGRKAQVEFNRQAGAAAMLAEAGKENLEQSALTAIAAGLQRATGSAAWGSNEFGEWGFGFSLRVGLDLILIVIV